MKRKLKNSGIILHQSHNLINNNSLEEYPCPFVSMPVHFFVKMKHFNIQRSLWGRFHFYWIMITAAPIHPKSQVSTSRGRTEWHSLCSASRHLRRCIIACPWLWGPLHPQSSRFCWRSRVTLLLVCCILRIIAQPWKVRISWFENLGAIPLWWCYLRNPPKDQESVLRPTHPDPDGT